MSGALYDGYRQGELIASGRLHGGHIGEVISFRWTDPESRIKSVVIAELRQIYHTAGETVLNLTAHDENTGGALFEVVMTSDHEVLFMNQEKL